MGKDWKSSLIEGLFAAAITFVVAVGKDILENIAERCNKKEEKK